jgi:hypothetical protein
MHYKNRHYSITVTEKSAIFQKTVKQQWKTFAILPKKTFDLYRLTHNINEPENIANVIKNVAKLHGYKNHQTWSVATSIQNDRYLRLIAMGFMKSYQSSLGTGPLGPYWKFIYSLGIGDQKTIHGTKWLSTKLDHKALNQMMRELS